MRCPQCGTENSDTSRFCMRCGSSLSAPPTPPPTPPPVQQTPAQQTPPQQSPAQPTPAQQAPPRYGPQPQQVPQPAGYSSYGPPPQSAPPRVAVNVSALNLWGPFGGFGTPLHYAAWLLEGAGAKFQDLVENAYTAFRTRQMPQTGVNFEALTARAVSVENRPYLVIRRGPVNIGIYINQFGQDLFISLAAFVKSPISRLRVILISVMAVLWLLTTLFSPQLFGSFSISSLGSLFGGGQSFMRFLYCIVGQLAVINYLALALFVLYSVYKWLTEKDILAGLREKVSEFNRDDMIAMIFAVEQTIRSSLEEVDLNPDDLKEVLLEDSVKAINI